MWEEAEGGAIRRIFGAHPVPLLAPEAFEQRRESTGSPRRSKAALAPHAGGVVRVEIEHGLDKVLVLDDGDRCNCSTSCSATPRWAFEAYRDGRIVVPDGNARAARSVPVAVRRARVIGDYLWFADAEGADLARDVALPWIGADDRAEARAADRRLIDAG